MSRSEFTDILVTRELASRQISYAHQLGLNPVIFPAIRIEFADDWKQVSRKLNRFSDAVWAFTSRNGVKGLDRFQQSIRRPADSHQNVPGIFAVGEKTAEALEEMGLNARIPARQDATGLAELIIQSSGQSGFDSVIHWCGNRSRKELKKKLSDAEINLTELEVYRTELNKMELPDVLTEAILFYSPSSVEAFRKSGGFNRNLPELFAIGNTTGEALSLESGKNVHIPANPSTEFLLNLVAEVLKENHKQ